MKKQLLLVLLGFVVFVASMAWLSHVMDDRQKAAARRELRRRHAAHEEELKLAAPIAERAARTHLAAAAAAERMNDYAGVSVSLAEVTRILEPYRRLGASRGILSDLLRESGDAHNRARLRAEIHSQINAVRQKEREALQLIAEEKWVLADEALEEAMGLAVAVRPKINEVPEPIRAPDWTTRLDQSARSLRREKTRIATRVRRARKAEEEHNLLTALCGSKPFCSGWDGECGGLEAALRRSAHDPGSIDVENCSDPMLTKNQCWVTTCDVRGRNAFGALVLQRETFSISKVGVERIQ